MNGPGAGSGRWLIAGAVALSVALLCAYLAAGGASYEPTPVADPCDPREWTEPGDVEESAQQFLLSALDGAACELGTSREELAAGLATEQGRADLAADLGIDDARLEEAVRAGLLRAIEDAEAAGAISALVASSLRAVATRVPVDEAVGLLADAERLIEDADDLLGGLGDLLDQAGDLP